MEKIIPLTMMGTSIISFSTYTYLKLLKRKLRKYILRYEKLTKFLE